jgi:hypothetical protein
MRVCFENCTRSVWCQKRELLLLRPARDIQSEKNTLCTNTNILSLVRSQRLTPRRAEILTDLNHPWGLNTPAHLRGRCAALRCVALCCAKTIE